MPDSQRYPTNQEDWEILLGRQNTILKDLLANAPSILIVTGDNHAEGYAELHPIDGVKSIEPFAFTRLEPIDLHLLSPGEYENGQTYTPMFTEQIWQPHKLDGVLKDIAEWNLEAFFISVQNQCIISPYDGGMDIILRDSETRDFYRVKYEAWLSSRKDGL